MSRVEFILMDIEGTTTSIDFVHETLFPYSYDRLDSFLTSHPELKTSVDAKTLKSWIKEDKKDSELKKIQGLIWQMGYENGEIKGHLYEEVADCFKNWKHLGLELGIYSSGSTLAQKLLFKYSVSGDLTSFLSSHFDTRVGAKREVNSYLQIAKELNRPSSSILFLSDIKEELEAAAKAGFQVGQLVRKSDVKIGNFKTYKSFRDIQIA